MTDYVKSKPRGDVNMLASALCFAIADYVREYSVTNDEVRQAAETVHLLALRKCVSND